ncbi:hypothetical protein CBS101457_006443 [Exobasidium rhododendri]|nr:hypothetical protein CBS101457_006443 [Exobasidium rhododendri]
MLSNYGRAATTPMKSIIGSRSLAQVTNAKVEPFLLEDMAEYKTGRVDNLPPFVISRQRGFLPRKDPLAQLPPMFEAVDSLLKRMTIHQAADSDGKREAGLLANGSFGQAVLNELGGDGREVKAVDEAIASGKMQLISALFRDYCFMTSAYLLEPVDQSYRRTGFYDKGRDVLPRQLAVPLKKLADALSHFPYMEYASSYALTNYRVKDPHHNGLAGKYSFDNMELIRAFEDAAGSERGFILVHVEMVSYSGQVIDSVESALAAANSGDVKGLEAAFEKLLLTYRKINQSMETMWKRSLAADYLKFRSFIFGTGPTKMNALFPNGVIYEGVSDSPQYYRGESGANDSLIPTLDNLLELTAHFPVDNSLTMVLREFRSYRPVTQKEYLEALEGRASMAGIRSFAQQSPRSKALYILLVDQVREFRNRHWMFTKEYIIKRSNYGLATGGSDILKYLPQNLSVVLKVLEESHAEWTAADEFALHSDKGSHDLSSHDLVQAVQDAGKRAGAQRNLLTRDVQELVEEKERKSKMAKSEANSQGMIGGDEDDRLKVKGSVGCDGVG